jgi:hypothetical protein
MGAAYFIKVADHLGLLKPETCTAARLARTFRNLIHPGRAARLAQNGRLTVLTAERRVLHTHHAQIARRANMSHGSALASSGKSQALFRTSCGLEEGRFAIVTNVGSGMRWTRPHVRRTSRSRTAKACGPGAPTLALSSHRRSRVLRATGQESPVPGKNTKHAVNQCAGSAR